MVIHVNWIVRLLMPWEFSELKKTSNYWINTSITALLPAAGRRKSSHSWIFMNGDSPGGFVLVLPLQHKQLNILQFHILSKYKVMWKVL